MGKFSFSQNIGSNGHKIAWNSHFAGFCTNSPFYHFIVFNTVFNYFWQSSTVFWQSLTDFLILILRGARFFKLLYLLNRSTVFGPTSWSYEFSVVCQLVSPSIRQSMTQSSQDWFIIFFYFFFTKWMDHKCRKVT